MRSEGREKEDKGDKEKRAEGAEEAVGRSPSRRMGAEGENWLITHHTPQRQFAQRGEPPHATGSPTPFLH
ncbi:MAG: hypothetical protein N4J56_003706 [Chroococcidiopsis sp. SAG 2025]|uniref:hypothetical protein n=1 Tax=Chroococcidiopsis sp. SAG 2025 TaxID=171389 RepID=UPI002936EBC3|nr:hypothetical protein [Chroococcidiopsis sp. SAG 2025]MDV2994052.1 hypothetical protein [Chroococcidiopsis sp. SAG 2025]